MNEIIIKEKKYKIQKIINESNYATVYLVNYENKNYIIKHNNSFTGSLTNEYIFYLELENKKNQYSQLYSTINNNIIKYITHEEYKIEEKIQVYTKKTRPLRPNMNLILDNISNIRIDTKIVTEYAGEYTLDKIDITKYNIVNIFNELLRIILVLHNMNMFHGDIKPANIITNTNNSNLLYPQFILIDFCTSQHINSDSEFNIIRCTANYMFLFATNIRNILNNTHKDRKYIFFLSDLWSVIITVCNIVLKKHVLIYDEYKELIYYNQFIDFWESNKYDYLKNNNLNYEDSKNNFMNKIIKNINDDDTNNKIFLINLFYLYYLAITTENNIENIFNLT